MDIQKIEIGEAQLLQDPKLLKLVQQADIYFQAIAEKKLPEPLITKINEHVFQINNITQQRYSHYDTAKKHLQKIAQLIEKETGWVPQHFYQSRWTSLGLGAFGVPFGVVYGLLMNNMGLMGLGFPVGIGLGALIGHQLDKKAKNEGRQIEVALK